METQERKRGAANPPFFFFFFLALFLIRRGLSLPGGESYRYSGQKRDVPCRPFLFLSSSHSPPLPFQAGIVPAAPARLSGESDEAVSNSKQRQQPRAWSFFFFFSSSLPLGTEPIVPPLSADPIRWSARTGYWRKDGQCLFSFSFPFFFPLPSYPLPFYPLCSAVE